MYSARSTLAWVFSEQVAVSSPKVRGFFTGLLSSAGTSRRSAISLSGSLESFLSSLSSAKRAQEKGGWGRGVRGLPQRGDQ